MVGSSPSHSVTALATKCCSAAATVVVVLAFVCSSCVFLLSVFSLASLSLSLYLLSSLSLVWRRSSISSIPSKLTSWLVPAAPPSPPPLRCCSRGISRTSAAPTEQQEGLVVQMRTSGGGKGAESVGARGKMDGVAVCTGGVCVCAQAVCACVYVQAVCACMCTGSIYL